MKRLFIRLNNHVFFDPSRWPFRELLSKIFAVLIVTAFIYNKLDSFLLFPGTLEGVKHYFMGINNHLTAHHFSDLEIQLVWGLRMAIWMIETGILVFYIVAYLSRTSAVLVAKGFMEVVFPFMVAVIPIIMAMTPYNFNRYVPNGSKYYILFYSGTALLMIAGGSINLIGLYTLRKSFTIMSEARTLITTGIFRFVRHPLYVGHFIMFFGSLCLRLHYITIIMYVAFVGGQILRTQIEEKKLAAAFPDYNSYRNRTPKFFPIKFNFLYKK